MIIPQVIEMVTKKSVKMNKKSIKNSCLLAYPLYTCTKEVCRSDTDVLSMEFVDINGKKYLMLQRSFWGTILDKFVPI